MPVHTGYLEKDPVYRSHIYEWTSDFADAEKINAEAGMGYFIHRSKKDVIIRIPAYPMDGDVISIIDVTKEHELAEATANIYISNVYPGAHTDAPNIIYNKKTYQEGQSFPLDYLRYYQQFFIYVERIHAWIASYVRIDSTIREVVVQQTYGIIYYGVSDAPANFADRNVDVDDTFVLGVGANVRIVFQNECTVPNPTLNVNNTGNIPIKVTQKDVATPGLWNAGQAIDLVYDGECWLIVDTARTGNGTSTQVGDALTKKDVNTLIEEYLTEHNITGADVDKIKEYVEDWLANHGGGIGGNPGYPGGGYGGGLSEYDVRNIVNNTTIEYWQVEAAIQQWHVNYGFPGGGGTGGGTGGIVPTGAPSNIEFCRDYAYNNGNNSCFCAVIERQDSISKLTKLFSGFMVRVRFSYDSDYLQGNVRNAMLRILKNSFTWSSYNVQSATIGTEDGKELINIYDPKTNGFIDIKTAWKKNDIVDFVLVYDNYTWKWFLVLKNGIDQTGGGTSVTLTDEIKNEIAKAVNAAITGQVSTIIDNKLQVTVNTINGDVQSKINELQASFKTTVDGLNSDINKTKQDLQQDIANAINDIKGNINTQISTAFDATIDQKIKANFDGVVQQQITNATDTLTAQITNATTQLNTKIETTRTELTTNVTNAVNELNGNINSKLADIKTEVQTLIDNTFATTIDQKIDAAFTATIDQKIEAAFAGAEGTLNTAIAGYQQSINKQFTEIQSELNKRVDGIQAQVTTSLEEFRQSITTIINDTFDTKIEEKIDTVFDTKLDTKIQQNFDTVVQQKIDTATTQLNNKLKIEIDNATKKLNDDIKALTTTIDQRIEDAYNRTVKTELDRLKNELNSSFQQKINDLSQTIDQKIKTTFDTQIDQKISQAFNTQIEQKINEIFNAQIDDKINVAIANVNANLDKKIDARITASCNKGGSINTYVEKALNDYIAPAIGASY